MGTKKESERLTSAGLWGCSPLSAWQLWSEDFSGSPGWGCKKYWEPGALSRRIKDCQPAPQVEFSAHGVIWRQPHRSPGPLRRCAAVVSTLRPSRLLHLHLTLGGESSWASLLLCSQASKDKQVLVSTAWRSQCLAS